MKIGLIDVDSHNFPNLPLMKISAYHKRKGDSVTWYRGGGDEHFDVVYKSKVFDFTPDKCTDINAGLVIKGGTGYGARNILPYYIEHEFPDYSLYPDYESACGFLTRGCPRGCRFCIVKEKEGVVSKRVAELGDFYNGQNEITLLDPNILACRYREELFHELINTSVFINFKQGLDIRLINKDIISLLNMMKIKKIYFAWDNPNENLIPQFKLFDRYYKRKSPDGRVVYVLTNFGSSHEEDLMRVYILRALRFDPYVMIYKKETAPRKTRLLQR